MSLPWQRRRTAFNHDWLKNRYLPALASWINILDDKIQDSELEQTFETRILVQWEGRRDEALALVDAYPIEMSPRRLIKRAPVSECGGSLNTELGDLMHELWLFRHHVRKRVCLATARVKAADAAYVSVLEGLRGHERRDYRTSWRSVRADFEAFFRHCRKLGRTLARFQDEITAV